MDFNLVNHLNTLESDECTDVVVRGRCGDLINEGPDSLSTANYLDELSYNMAIDYILEYLSQGKELRATVYKLTSDRILLGTVLTFASFETLES